MAKFNALQTQLMFTDLTTVKPKIKKHVHKLKKIYGTDSKKDVKIVR